MNTDTTESDDTAESSDTAESDGRFERLFNQLADAIVEFRLEDGQPLIVDGNKAFCDAFAHGVEDVTGEPLNELIVPTDHQQEAKAFDQRTADGESNAAVVERMTVDGNRTFIYRGVPCDDGHGFAIYTDITEELRRERHLDVLQRVLRHNLRNDLNVVLGMTQEVIDTAETDRTREAARTIRQTAERLSQLSDEAKLVHRVLGEPTHVEPTPLTPVITDVVADCRGRFTDATIMITMPEPLAVSADSRLKTVVENLIENAIEHNTSQIPRVAVEATAVAESAVEISVTDNGPGIPLSERRVVTGNEDITPLNHGSGLGLWLVKWITDSYGGTLEIEVGESGGSTVRIQLDRQTEA